MSFVGKQIRHECQETVRSSSQIFMRPRPLPRYRMSGPFIQEVFVFVEVLIQPPMEGAALGGVKAPYESKQNNPGFGLGSFGCPSGYNPLHMHQAHLIRNA